MTISSQTRKAGPFVGNDSSTAFPFAFKVFQTSDLLVVRANSAGVETVLVLGTNYSVTLNADQNSNPGGTVTLTAALATGYTLVLTSQVQNLQPTDLTNQGGFYPRVITDALDRATIQIQQLQEEVDRSAKLPITNTEDADALVADILRLADSADNIDTVAGSIADVNTVAGDIADVSTVAGIAGNVTTVAGIASNVTAVAGNATNINAVAGNATNINAVAGNNANVTAVAGNATNINAVAGNATNINTVAGVSANVTTVAGIAANVTTVAGVSANVTTVAGIAANVTTVAGIDGDVSAVSTIAANVTTVAGIDTDVTAVAGVAADIPTVADNLADIHNFADVYQGAKASAPTLRNDGGALQLGDLYFDTTLDQMRVYAAAGWEAASSSVNGTSARFRYIATAGQTTFTGVDSNGNTLAYDAGYADVYLNGVRLDQADYTGTSGTSIVLASGAALNDELNIIAFGTFNVASVNGVNIVDGTVTAAKLATDSVTADKIAAGAVGSSELASGAAVANIGYTPMNKAGDTVNGAFAVAASGAPLTVNSTNSNDLKVSLVNNGTAVGHFGASTTYPHMVANAAGTVRAAVNANGQQFTSIDGFSALYAEYGCRAWVNFNGTGTVAIRASGNVSSITDNGTGNYTANFSNSMPDGNYACSLGIGNDSGSSGAGWWVSRLPTHSTTGCQILTGRPDNGAYADASVVNAAFFR